MATDNTHLPQTDDAGTSMAQEFNPEVVQLAQADTTAPGAPAGTQAPVIPGAPNGEVKIEVPAGQTVVRVQVAPGETIDLPFDGALAAKIGQQGNLAIKSGDTTIILIGYGAANQQTGVTLHDQKGHTIDVATVVAQTDPNLDIQTAAGPAAGPAGGPGGHLFFGFSPNGALGGLGELGVINPTELQYKLIQPDEQILLVQPTTDTTPQLVNVTTPNVVNEDDFQANHGIEEAAVVHNYGETGAILNPDLQGQIENSPIFTNVYYGTFLNHDQGNDPHDTGDHEEGSQNGSNQDDNGDPVTPLDLDREPLTVNSKVTVNFFNDLPGKILLENGGTSPTIDHLIAMNLTSHGLPLHYALLPETATHGESIVAYIDLADSPAGREEEFSAQVLIFSIEVGQPQGVTSLSTFDINFTIFGTIDNLITNADIADHLNIDTIFFIRDSNGTVVEVPPQTLVFQDVDDVPALGQVNYDFEGNVVELIPANLTLGINEHDGQDTTPHYQADLDKIDPNHASDPAHSNHQTSDQVVDDVDPKNFHLSDANSLLTPALNSGSYADTVLNNIDKSFFNSGDPHQGFTSMLGAAQNDSNYAYNSTNKLAVDFGADGPATGNTTQFGLPGQAGPTLFDKDASTELAHAFELYMQDKTANGAPVDTNHDGVADGNLPVDKALTNLTISYDDGSGTVQHLDVTAYQLDPYTIIGVSDAPQFDEEVPSFAALRVAIDGPSYDGGGIPVFAIHIDPDSGQMTLIQYHQVDNLDADGNPTDLTHLLNQDGSQLLHFRATDFDGDHIDAPLEITFVDDVPQIVGVHYNNEDESQGSGKLDEDFLYNLPSPNHDEDTDPDNTNNAASNGDGPGGKSVSGHIDVTTGVDLPVSFAFHIAGLTNDGDQVAATDKNGNALFAAGGYPITLELNKLGNDWVVTGRYSDGQGSHDAFTLDLNSQTGDFNFVLIAALQHPDHGTGRFEDNLNLDFGVQVTDSDKDSAATTLSFVVNDDAPMMIEQPTIIQTQTYGTEAQVEALAAVSEGTPCLQENIYRVIVTADNVPLGVTISATDDKGAPGNVNLVSGKGIGVVSDTDGGVGGRFDEINFDEKGGVSGNGGSEGLTFHFDHLLSSGTVELAKFFSGEGGVGDERGHWSALRNGVEVGHGDIEANSSTGQFGFALPTIAGGFDTLVFTALTGSAFNGTKGDQSDYLVQRLDLVAQPINVQTGEFAFRFGADNGNLPKDGHGGDGFVVSTTTLAGEHLTSGGVELTYATTYVEDPVTHHTHVVVTGYKGDAANNQVAFVLDIDPVHGEGSGGEHGVQYTFTDYLPLDNNGGNGMSNLPFDVTITDRDGDAIQTQIAVCIDDSKPRIDGDPVEASVFEKGLDQAGTSHDGSAKGDGSNITSGFFNFFYNGDGPGHITNVHFQGFAGTPSIPASDGVSDGLGHWVINNALFNLTVDQITGAYTFTLKENLAHVTPNDIIQDLHFGLTVVDGDGSTATQSDALIINVVDDVPQAHDDHNTVFGSADHLHATGNVISGSGETPGGADLTGADGVHVEGAAAGNLPLTVVNPGAGGTVINGIYGDLTIHQDGSYTYAQHSPAPDNVATETFSYELKDGDGDPASAKLDITVSHAPQIELTTGDEPVPVIAQTLNLSLPNNPDGSASVGDYLLNTSIEGHAINPALVNGVDPANLHMNFDADVQVTFEREGAGAHNMVGVYSYDSGGNIIPGSVKFLWLDASQTVQDVLHNALVTDPLGNAQPLNIDLGNLPAGTNLGFFLLVDGANNPSTVQTLLNVAGGGGHGYATDLAAINAVTSITVDGNGHGHVVVNGTQLAGDALFTSDENLNTYDDGHTHALSGVSTPPDGNLYVGFEDRKIGGNVKPSDKDYNDIVFGVNLGAQNLQHFTPAVFSPNVNLGDQDNDIVRVDLVTTGFMAGDALLNAVSSNGFIVVDTPNGDNHTVTITEVVPESHTGAQWQAFVNSIGFSSTSQVDGERDIKYTVTDVSNNHAETTAKIDLVVQHDESLSLTALEHHNATPGTDVTWSKGDDTLYLDKNFTAADGHLDMGGGFNTVQIGANGENFTGADASHFSNVHGINATGFGANSVILNINDILPMIGGDHKLQIDGDAGIDKVNLDGNGGALGNWLQEADVTIGGKTYNEYQWHASGGATQADVLATVLVDHNLIQTITDKA